MKTSLRILTLLFLITCAGINSASAQITACTTSITGQNKICAGGCATLNAFYANPGICSGVTYQWATGQTTSSIVVCPSITTTYIVMGCCTSPNQCCDTTSFTVLVAPNPTVTITGTDTICSGQSTTLCANTMSGNGNTYLWMPGGQTNMCIVETPTITTTYTATITAMSGCSGSSTYTVNVINCNVPPCVASINGSTQICGAGCTILSAGFSTTLNCPGLSYSWFPGGQTTSSIVVCPTSSTSYSVIVCCNDLSGCCDTASVTVNVSTPPVVMISGSDTICSGQGTALCTGAMAGASYLWMPGAQTTACMYAAPTITTTYTATVTDANGCSGASTFTLTVIPCSTGGCTASLTGQNKVCSGSCATLSASMNSNSSCMSLSYQWFPGGQTTSSIVVCPTATTSYVAMVCCNGMTTSCCDTAAFTVTVDQLPVVTVTGPTSICNGQTTTLCVNSGVSWLWMPGNITTMCAVVSPASTTTYTVTVTDANGCSAATTHVLTVITCTTGAEENYFSDQVELFPNPFSEYVTVRIQDARLLPCEMKIYNLLGTEVKRTGIESSEIKIYRDNLPSGIYFYKLSQKERTVANGKIIIK